MLTERGLEEILAKLVSVSCTIQGIRLPHNKLTSSSVYSLVVSPSLTKILSSVQNVAFAHLRFLFRTRSGPFPC